MAANTQRTTRAPPPRRLSLITSTPSFYPPSPVASPAPSPSPAVRRPNAALRRASSISYNTRARSTPLHTPTISSIPPEIIDKTTNDASPASPPPGSPAPGRMTLIDQHAALLRQIAEKQSTVLDLRTQLTNQERELAELQKQWESVLQTSLPNSTPASANNIVATQLKDVGRKVIAAAAAAASTSNSSLSSPMRSSMSSDDSDSIATPPPSEPCSSPKTALRRRSLPPAAAEPSPDPYGSIARGALPGTLGLSMMYKEVHAGLSKSQNLKRASLFLGDMLSTALGSPVPTPSSPAPPSSLLDDDDDDEDRTITSSGLPKAPSKPGMNILVPDNRRTNASIEPKRKAQPKPVDDDFDEWNW